MKHADGSQMEMDTSESLFDRRRGARKGLFLPHSQRGKFKEIQGIKMRYNIGINHGKSPSACRLGLTLQVVQLKRGIYSYCSRSHPCA